MYLAELKLWNFRKFGSGVGDSPLDLGAPDLVLPFNSQLNLLIGENDSGKSAVIDSIKLALDTHSSEWLKVYPEDFYLDTTRLRIECLFKDLSDEEAKNFTEWLGMDNDDVYLRVILDANKKGDRVLPYDVRAGVDEMGHRLSAEAKEYLKTTYLRPLRDAKSELMPRRNSRLSQILSGHEAFKEKGESHWLMTEVFEKFNDEVESYFSEVKSGDDGGKKLKEKLESYLESFFGEKKGSIFSPTKKKLKEILEILKLALEEDNLGLGSHNLLFIAAELLNLERSNWTGLRLGLIEEVEAHLHPQTQMKVMECLQDLTEKTSGGIQLILTTHSPNIGSKVKLKNIILFCQKKAYRLDPSSTKLASDDYIFLERFLDVTKANLFFAKGVILVEGWAEELILPALAKKVGHDLTKKGISIVNIASTAFLRYSRIFLRQDEANVMIPVSIVTDLDVKPDQENVSVDFASTTHSQRDLAIKKKQDEYAKQSVKVFISPHWTLEYCLAKSDSLGNLFLESVKEVHPRINADDFLNEISRKLESNDLKKTEIAQIFSRKVNDSSVDLLEIESDEDIKYLVEAIKYASGS